jgi:hypothetical protein
MSPSHIFETVMDKTISTSTPAQSVNLAGYREYAVLARFEGPPSAEFRMEINNHALLVTQEQIKLNANGWLNFARVYKVYAPDVGIVIYHPPANLRVRMTVYAGM